MDKQPQTRKTIYSGILLVRSARDWDFLYRLNVVHTKKCDCVRIFSLLYADLYDRIDIACLTVPALLNSVGVISPSEDQITQRTSIWESLIVAVID